MLPNPHRDFVTWMEGELVEPSRRHTKATVEKQAARWGISDPNGVKELTELAIVNVARRLAHQESKSVRERYADIVALYGRQVSLSHRTSQSILLQQYSTPAPLGYLMGVFCGADELTGRLGFHDWPNQRFGLEPSAGNGLLTIAGKPEWFKVNELDAVRRANLQSQGFLAVTGYDASVPFPEMEGYDQAFDAVLTNPPFGKLNHPERADSFTISDLDHLMAIRALSCMKDAGRAAIIIGGHTAWDERGRIQAGKNRIFLNWLHRHYHVADCINIDGDLYKRQGTGFNVRLILVDGRKRPYGSGSDVAPLKRPSDTTIRDFDTLFERVMQYTKKRTDDPMQKLRLAKAKAKMLLLRPLSGFLGRIGVDAAKARAEGKFMERGVLYKRQQPFSDDQVIWGATTSIQFALDVNVFGRYALIPARLLQPSHREGVENPLHFIPDAQPRNRSAGVSTSGSNTPRKIAGHLNPAAITEGATAYSGAPVTNSRGEVIQGSGRGDALRIFWSEHEGESQRYLDYLIQHCEHFGFSTSFPHFGRDTNPTRGNAGRFYHHAGETFFRFFDPHGNQRDVRNPVLVRVVDANDDYAIRLGQYNQADTEAVATATTHLKAKARLLDDEKLSRLVDRLLERDNGEKTLSELIRESDVLRLLTRQGVIRADDLEKYVRADGEISPDGVDFCKKLLLNALFAAGDVSTADIFAQLPYAAQMGLEKACLYLLKCRGENSLATEVARAVLGSRDWLATGLDFGAWANQADMFGGGSPADTYTPTERAIIRLLGSARTQKEITLAFQHYADAVSGRPGSMLEAGTSPVSKAQAVEIAFGVKSTPLSVNQRLRLAQAKARMLLMQPLDGLGMAYLPASRAGRLDVDTPDSMGYETTQALAKLRQRVGDVDAYVRTRLGYAGQAELEKALAAEQIDAVALGIYNVEQKGQGIIVGDQTGIGKGRTAAAMIRYGVQQGMKPIFLTEKPNLFSDLYRDLIAIGSGHLVPFIVNADEPKSRVKDENGLELHRPLSPQEQKFFLSTRKLPPGAHFVMVTYSQLSGGEFNKRGELLTKSLKGGFIESLASGNLLILDEAHNASGESNTGKVLSDVVVAAKGVLFLSATFAKRPDNLPIYALKTCLSEANLSREELVAAILRGGVALQEVMASQLVAQGQMVRRERTFEGIEVNYITLDAGGARYGVPDKAAEHRAIADNVTQIVRDIIAFQAVYIDPEIEDLDKQVAALNQEVESRRGTSGAGVDNAPYFSKVFQVINQMLFAIKAEAVAERAIQRLREGKKPVIAFASTMGSFIESLEDDNGLPIGDGAKIKADFATVLMKGLQGILRYTVISAEGEKEHKSFDISLFSPEAQDEFRRIAHQINTVATGIVISPIDLIRQRIQEAGYSVAEVTGRKYEVALRGGGLGLGRLAPDGGLFTGKAKTVPSMGVVQLRKRENTNDAFRRFNNNEVDVLMINQSGSTGASAHAIATAKVPASQVKPRVMIVLQAELDISTEVQKRGRVNRTGQLFKPGYDYLISAIPAEKRMMMMLQKKLKSLDANTTSNQKNSEALLKTDDFLNKYGDKVVLEYLKENPKLNLALGDPLKLTEAEGDSEKRPVVPESAAHKVSGRVAVLPTAEQEEFYNEVLRRYEKFVERLREQDEYDLEVDVMNLRAERKTRVVRIEGKGGESAFGDNTYLESCEVDVLTKPYTAPELDNLVRNRLGPATPGEYAADLESRWFDRYADNWNEKKEETLQRYTEAENGIDGEKGYLKLTSEEARREYRKSRRQEIDAARVEFLKKNQQEFDNRVKTLTGYFRFFRPGKVVQVPSSWEDSDGATTTMGVSLGVVMDEGMKKGFLPSNLEVAVALASSRKRITFALSEHLKLSAIVGKGGVELVGNWQDEWRNTLSAWGGAITEASKDRNQRWFATGNVLQAFGDPDLKGKLVQYTMLDGRTRKGILLSDSFKPAAAHKNDRVKVPIGKCGPLLRAMPLHGTVNSPSLSILRNGARFQLIVPASKRQGGTVYLDSDLLAVVEGNRFDKSGDSMRAYVPGAAIDRACHAMRKLGLALEFDRDLYEQYAAPPPDDQGTDEIIVPVVPQTPEPEDASSLAFRLRLAKAKARILLLKPL